MKRIWTLSFAVGALCALVCAAVPVQAQDCEAYYPMKAGAKFELANYNDKDKLQSTTITTIEEKESSGGRIVMLANTVSNDAKGKEQGKYSYDLICDNGEFRLDMRSMMSSQQQMSGVEGLEIKIQADEMAFPRNLTVGSTLPDASVTMQGIMNGMTIMNTIVHITNRKVVAKESLTTPAGTFDCIVMEQDSEVKTMGMNIQGHSKTWYSLGVGMVRSENYSKGKMDSYQLLTSFSN